MSESQKTQKPAPVETVPVVVQEKQNFLAKTKHFVKEHKKTTIAVGLLGALVVVASVTGKKVPATPAPDDSIEIETHEDGTFTVRETTDADA